MKKGYWVSLYYKIDNHEIINHLEKMVRQKVKEIKTEKKKIITKA